MENDDETGTEAIDDKNYPFGKEEKWGREAANNALEDIRIKVKVECMGAEWMR